MTWIAEMEVVWIVNGRPVHGRIAVGAPEVVPSGNGEAICEVALDGLQPVTRVHGEGTFHALALGMKLLGSRIHDHVDQGVRVMFSDEETYDHASWDSSTETIMAMFGPWPRK
jgi:hypothetical protein